MREALSRSLSAFQANSDCDQRVLVLMSDGHATDGDPGKIATELHAEGVAVASAYLTSDHDIAQRPLYDKPAYSWDKGQRTLFNIASKVFASNHPIPVLMSVGWQIPCSGEVPLYVCICTETAVEEFCSLLVSAHVGSTDALLDVIGRLRLGGYIQDEHAITCKNPSDQGSSATCYAHAAAAVMHMALLRIERKEPCLTIGGIRGRIEEGTRGDLGIVYRKVTGDRAWNACLFAGTYQDLLSRDHRVRTAKVTTDDYVCALHEFQSGNPIVDCYRRAVMQVASLGFDRSRELTR
ncbi:hypothetical protein BDV10DRAFT_182541 [Aspergillus recurvatus]